MKIALAQINSFVGDIENNSNLIIKRAKEASKKSGSSGASLSLEKGMMGGRLKPTLHSKGGKVSSASRRADGCAIKGKTKGRMV